MVPTSAIPPPAMSCFMPWDLAPGLSLVDRAPDAKTSAESNHESLKHSDCSLKKCHIHSNSRFLRLLS